MTEMFRPNELIIGDHNWHEHVDAVIDGEKKSRGLVPRDYNASPFCFSPYSKPFKAINMPLIPRNEWVERITEMAANKSRLSDIRRSSGPNGGHIPSLDQDSWGFCWIHSGTMAAMLDRAVRNLPYVRLSAFGPGCLIKNYRNEGGWGAQGLDFIIQHGIPSVEFWPEKSSSRSNDTAEMRANALLHRVAEYWMDLEPAVYNRNMSEDQSMTCLLNRQPIIMDENWWGHSICGMDPVVASQTKSLLATDFDSLDLNVEKDLAVYAAAFGKRFINSWTDSYGDLGEGVLTGTKAILNGGAAICSSYASAA
jgi:hypothetical protein